MLSFPPLCRFATKYPLPPVPSTPLSHGRNKNIFNFAIRSIPRGFVGSLATWVAGSMVDHAQRASNGLKRAYASTQGYPND